jgi:hypothetical protein
MTATRKDIVSVLRCDSIERGLLQTNCGDRVVKQCGTNKACPLLQSTGFGKSILRNAETQNNPKPDHPGVACSAILADK